jgi:hypothetical protein
MIQVALTTGQFVRFHQATRYAYERAVDLNSSPVVVSVFIGPDAASRVGSFALDRVLYVCTYDRLDVEEKP